MISTQRRFFGLPRAILLFAGMLWVGLAAGLVHAQTADVDPPGRVARLADLNGQVWYYSPDEGDWVGAVRNAPLTSGDRIATDAGAHAELQIGSTTVRLDSSTELEVVELDDDHIEFQLHDGSVATRVRDVAGAGEFEISTDEGRFVVQRAGSYRFDRNDAKSDATVYSGQIRYEGPNSGLPVDAGQRAEFWIDSGGVAQYTMMTPASDAFAAWNNDRERPVANSVATRYVSPEMTGAEDLDRYGRWEQDADYGSVWIPTTVAADWAPYSHGHWVSVRPWGWTWVDDAPWGFAPFHYGRWVYARNNWCWTPGVRVQRPVYAPALVAWVGGPRGNVSVTVGGGPAVGWFALAPREVYVPSYHVSPRYARNINITHVTNVTQITNVFKNPQAPRDFENRRFPRAVTVVPTGVMTDRRPVAPAAAQMRQTPWVRDIATRPGRTVAMIAPPVAAPAPRNPDPRAVRPPPGAAPGAADRSRGERPGFGQRGRDGSDDRRPGQTTRLGQPGFGPAGEPGRPGPRPPAATMTPPSPAATGTLPPAASVTPPLPAGRGPMIAAPTPQQPRPGIRPDLDNADRGTDRRSGVPPRPPGQRPGGDRGPGISPPTAAPVAAPQVAPPVAQPARPAVTPAPQEAPRMRTLPVHRGDDPRDGPRDDPRRGNDDRRLEERRAPPAPRIERPAPAPRPTPQVVVPRPAEVAAPRPAPQIVAPRPAEVAAPRAPEMRRPVAPPEVRRPAPAAAPNAPAEVRRPDAPQRPERGDQQR